MVRPQRCSLVIDGGMCDFTQSFMYNTLLSSRHVCIVFPREMSSLGFRD
jgi:hypothetical protein